jgi:hypothetical protein
LEEKHILVAMKKPVQISMPAPCPVKVEMMKPTADGWFCKGCQKTVYDFTGYSDEQLAGIYENKEGRCGMFLDTQINRELVVPKERKKNIWLAATAAIISFFAVGNDDATAQEPLQNQTSTTNISYTPEQEQGMIKGHVGNWRLSIKGAKVQVERTSAKTYTDEEGNFVIEAKVGDILKISGKGLKPVKVEVTDDHVQYISVRYRKKSKNPSRSPGYF